MKHEIVVLGAGKIGRGSLGLFFTRAGWKVDFYGHNPEKMRDLQEQGYYITRTESGQESRVEGFTILDCTSDKELVERLSVVNLCAVAAYEGAFPSMAASLARAIKQRVKHGFNEPLNVMLCVNDVHVVSTFENTIRPELNAEELAYFERYVGLCLVMVMSLGATAPEGENPWLVLTSDDPELQIDGDPWKGERIEVANVNYTHNGQGLITRKVFVGNMSHAMRAFLGHAKGQNFLDEGICEDAWAIANVDGALDEAYKAVSSAYSFDDEEEFKAHFHEIGDTPAHDPFTRIANSPAKKLSRDNRFIWPARKCLEIGVMPFYLARGAAYGLLYYLDAEEGGARPANRAEAEALVERICGLGTQDALLRDLIVDHFMEIPEVALIAAR